MNKSKKTYTTFGTVMRSKKDKPGDADRFYMKLEGAKDKNKQPYGEQIFPITLANGKVLNEGAILTMFSKKEKFAKAVKEGKMSQDQADKLDYLRFDVCIAEDVNEGNDRDDGGALDF